MSKITVIGAGSVGATIANDLMIQGIASEIVLIDVNKQKAFGEAMDIYQGAPFCSPTIVRSGDYDAASGSDIVIITSGLPRKAGQSRLELAQANVNIIKDIAPQITAAAPDAIYIIVSNPVDVMAWYAWKRSGLPRTQVLGTGTALDTSRLKTIIGEETGLDPRNVGGFVMGEHGDSQFTAWSTVSLGGKPFARFLADNQDRFASVSTTEIEEKTRTRGNEIVAAKGGTNFGIASTVAGIVQTILWDERRIVPVSTLLDGEYGEHDVFLGVPTELRANGANEIVELDLSEDERAKLHHSAELVREHCEGLL